MPRRHVIRFAAVALALIAPGPLMAGGLKYQFKPGETYVYSVSVVGELGSATQTTKGTLQLTAKSADGNQLQLTPFASLGTTVRQPATTGKKGFKGGPGGPFAKGPGGPKLVGPRELIIDRFGKVVKFSGETSLPLLMGTVEELVIEPLSPTGENRWQIDKDLVVREGGERAPKGPPRVTADTNTSAKETTTYEVAGSSGSVVTIKKTYDLKTTAQDGTSRFQFEGAGDISFDTQAGLIKNGEFKGVITVTEKNITFKVPVTASYRLMDAAEAAALKKQQEEQRAKAIQAAKDRATPKPPVDLDLNSALADLKSGDKFKIRKAADDLAGGVVVAERRDEIASILAPALKDLSLRFQVSKALKVWGTDKVIIPHLKDSDLFVRMEACKILAEIGTKECLPALQAALADSNPSVRREANAAVKAVQARKK